MATLVQISGLPATGKSTGLRALDPATTGIIDGDGKGLPWIGWKKDYSSEKGNYYVVHTVADAYRGFQHLAKNPAIKCIVIDTISTLMTNEEMAILENPARDAWSDLAVDVYKLYKAIRELKGRDDLVVYVLAHIEPYDTNGITRWRMKVPGKKLSKTNLNAHLNYNLYTVVTPTGVPGKYTYELRTNTDGTDEARSPMGMFEYTIPNDLEAVRKTIVDNE